MPKTVDMRESKFLKQTDVGRGALFTVSGCVQKNVAKEGADPEHKWCLLFAEEEKPLVINVTNLQLCEQIFGSDDTDEWIGKQLVLYTDPTVMYAGKVVGGIRVRAPRVATKQSKTAAPPPPHQPPPPAHVTELDDDDPPF